jgi:hypothetical protein
LSGDWTGFTIYKLGITPCVDVPDGVLGSIFTQAGKSSGPIPVRGSLDGKPFRQTLVRYGGAWRLYINTEMREGAGVGAGDEAEVELEFDPEPRVVLMRPEFSRALAGNREAKAAFDGLPVPQERDTEYLNSLKIEDAVARNFGR